MFKMTEETANVTMDLAKKIDAFLKSDAQHYAVRRQEFAQQLVKHYSIKEIEYKSHFNGKKHGFDFCSGCQKYTQQSLVKDDWRCDDCERITS